MSALPIYDGPCLSRVNGKCAGDHTDAFASTQIFASTCPAYACPACGRSRPWCFGGAPDERCDDCVDADEAFS